MAFDPIVTMNLVFCIILLILGIWGYAKKKDTIPLCIGVAFGIFGFAHLMTLLNLAEGMTPFLFVIRSVAYLLLVFTLYRIVKR